MEPALLPEIYLHTAQFISSPSTLASCCLVSKEFHRMFVPYLYRHLNLRSGPPTPDQKSQFDPASSLRRLDPAYLGDRFLLTKHFEASVRQNNDALISSYLWSMPNIVSLSIEFHCIDASHTCSALTDLPSTTLRDLEIRVAIDQGHYVNRTGRGWTLREVYPFVWPNISHFQNLRSLKLFGLDGDLSVRAKDIAKLLVASPQLKILGLGMVLNTFLQKYHPRHGANGRNKTLLMKDVIDEMQKLEPGRDSRLDLEELILGLGALPGTPLPVSQTIHDLSPLTKLENLQVLQLINGDTTGLEDHPDLLKIHPQAFHACTNLRRLTVDILSDDIVALIRFLHASSKSLVELEVNRQQDWQRSNSRSCPDVDGIELIGSRWKKMHMEYPYAAAILSDSMNHLGTYADLEDLSLAITTMLIDRLVGLEQCEPWELILKQLSLLPSLRRVLISWDQPLLLQWDKPHSPSIASRFANRLFTTNEQAMHSQNLPSNLVNVTLKPSNGDTRTFRRMFVPGGFETGADTGMEWRLVEVSKDEPSDWDWGAGGRGNTHRYDMN